MAKELLMSKARQGLLVTIGEERREKVWDALCDSLRGPFTTKQAEQVISDELQVSPKTASMWWNALCAFWLLPGHSDLVKIRHGLYDWENYVG